LDSKEENLAEKIKEELRRIKQRIAKEEDWEKKAKMLKAYREMIRILETHENHET